MKIIYPILILFFITFNSSFAQSSLFVSPSGSDNLGTGTITNPYKTVQKGAEQAEILTNLNPTTPVNVLVRGGLYRNSGFTTTSTLSVNAYDPENIGEAIWKTDVTNSNAIRLNNIDGNPNAWITIKPYNNEAVVVECDSDAAINVRNCSYVKIEGLEVKGVSEKIPLELAWQYWGTYRYLSGSNLIYGDRKQDICSVYNLSNCSDIPPSVLTTDFTYQGLPNIETLNVERPKIFIGKGVLVNLSHHIEIRNCNIHHFPGGGLRVTASDYVNVIGNQVHHSSNRASVGTHGLVIEGLEPNSGDNSANIKCLIANNTVYSNYNELYSWVQSKTICTTVIDEGKGIALLRTGGINGFNGVIRVENNLCYQNGKSGIHCNEVDDAQIVNNTVYHNAYTNVNNPTLSGGTQAGISIQSSNAIKIINNIAVVPNGLNPEVKALSEGQNCSGEVVQNNLVFGGATSDFFGGYVVDNPKFMDETNLNFNLLANSPAINNGTTNLAPAVDFIGATRTGNPDIGAFEYNPNLSTEMFFNQVDIQHIVNDNQLHIISSEKIKNIEIFDSVGKKIYSERNINNEQFSINLDSYSHGLLLVNVKLTKEYSKSIKISK